MSKSGYSTHEARELDLFISNDGDLYRQRTTPIEKNLANKKASGTYLHSRAVDAFMHLMESGAKKYVKEHGHSGDKWHMIFTPAVRREVAEAFAKSFEAEYALGNYNHLLHKKHQVDPFRGMCMHPMKHDKAWPEVHGRVGGHVKKTKLDDLQEMLPEGFSVDTYSPGDGVTRYRFFRKPNQDYFGGTDRIGTVLGYKAAEAMARGLAR